MQKRERRHKLQIYYDILTAIQEEFMNEGEVKPTRIQQLSNTSYDKLAYYIDELEAKQLVSKASALSLTDRGREFLEQYNKINELVGTDYGFWCLVSIDGEEIMARIVYKGRGKFRIVQDVRGKYADRIVDASEVIHCKFGLQ